jgi:hypothetical protein
LAGLVLSLGYGFLADFTVGFDWDLGEGLAEDLDALAEAELALFLAAGLDFDLAMAGMLWGCVEEII